MFAAIWLPQFRLQSALRWREPDPTNGRAGSPSQPSLHSHPVAVVDGDAARGIILEANQPARDAGVESGLTPAQALARCPQILILPRSADQEVACQRRLIEISLTASPRVEATAAGHCTLDLAGLPRATCWQKWSEQIVADCAAECLHARVGVAPHPDHAWLAACQAKPVNVVYNGAQFTASLPVSALDPSPELHAILVSWGIHTIEQFAKLPKAAVVERLGAEAAEMRARIGGRAKRVLKLVRPLEEYFEAFDFEYGIETTEPLLFLLRRFVDSLTGRLRAAHRVAALMELTLPLDSGNLHLRTFSIPSPTADADVLFRVLETHLETLTLDQQPVGVRLRLHASDPTGRQLHLFESSLRDPNRFGETLARLKALVGNDSVGIPQPANSHRPDAFVMEPFHEDLVENSEPARERGLPLQRLRPSIPADVRVHDGAPRWLESARWRGPIERVAGPYRISGDWWEASPWALEEWDVELAGDAGVLRLARQTGGWSVEGTYDVC